MCSRYGWAQAKPTVIIITCEAPAGSLGAGGRGRAWLPVGRTWAEHWAAGSGLLAPGKCVDSGTLGSCPHLSDPRFPRLNDGIGVQDLGGPCLCPRSPREHQMWTSSHVDRSPLVFPALAWLSTDTEWDLCLPFFIDLDASSPDPAPGPIETVRIPGAGGGVAHQGGIRGA